MATVYNIKLTICSPFVNYTEDDMKELIHSTLHSKRNENFILEFDKEDIEIKRH